jgi:hypothetical protein
MGIAGLWPAADFGDEDDSVRLETALAHAAITKVLT